MKKMLGGACLLFFFFLVTKKNSFQQLPRPVLSSFDYWILLICLATIQNEEKLHTKAAADVSRRGEVESIESFSSWGVNDLPGGRVCLGGVKVGDLEGKYVIV